jgi:predicted nucleic acid-binding Zn ribbon protein
MSAAARALANLRRKIAHACAVCGKRFKGLKTAVYCSNACRQKAKYQRSKQKDSV